MIRLFFFGTLRSAGLRRAVLGREVAVTPAKLEGHAVSRAGSAAYPTIEAVPGSAAEGLLAEVDPETAARIDWYEGLFGYTRRELLVTSQGGNLAAQVYWPPADAPAPGAAFDLASWEAAHLPLAVGSAEAAFASRDDVPDAVIVRRWPSIEARAQAKISAQAVQPGVSLRWAASPDDVTIEAKRVPYSAFFSVEEYDLRHVRFDGGQSDLLTRACFIMSDAVVVLPYDPVADAVLLVEQIRAGALGRGDPRPWTLETAAGRVDGGETPAEAARREAQEETGLTLDLLVEVPLGYASPGAVSEYLYGFIGLCRLPEATEGTFGHAEEGEDIRTHVVTFARLMHLIETGEVDTAPLTGVALHLALRRDALRAEAGAPSATGTR